MKPTHPAVTLTDPPRAHGQWETMLAIDFDKWSAETYRANFPGVRVKCGPVSDYIEALPGADVILGGPPCQPHSHAGKRLASKDSRDCGPDFVAAVARVKPRAFLMENVDGLLSSENGRYFQRLYASMEDAGYVVQYRVQDAVNYGVPQFRSRLWVWGIRRDLYVDGVRHCWPTPTHAWPPPEPNVLFGESLLPGVTVGEALGLEGFIRKPRSKSVIRRDHPTSEPCPTVESRASLGGGSCLKYIRVIGGGYNPSAGNAHLRTSRDITDEPSTTIAGPSGNALPEIHEYRWTDAMLEKHPPASPASPASPAPTVQAKWFKGGAEGLLQISPNQLARIEKYEMASGCINSRELSPEHPARTVTAKNAQGTTSDALRLRESVYVRRLTPWECARLQSMPDCFTWPEKISKTAMYRIIGNGWSCGHAAHFSVALHRSDPEARTVIDLFCGGGLGAVGWHGRFWSYEDAGKAVSA